MKVSNVNIGFRVVLFLLLIFTFFFFLGYPFSDLEIKILLGAGILLLLGVAILIGMLSNVIAGFAGFLIGRYIFDFICEFVANLLHLPDADIAMLYIYRVIAIVLIVYLLYSIVNRIKDNKEANRFLIQVVRERTFLKDHAQKCYNALNLIQNIVDEDDIREIGDMKAKKAYLEADLYEFGKVKGSVDSGWNDALKMIEELFELTIFYGDMKDI